MQDGSRACDQGNGGFGHQVSFRCRVVEQILPEETIPESHASLGALEGWHNLLQGQIRALRRRRSIWVIVGVTHQCVPWLVRHATWLLYRFQRAQNGATAFENLKGVSYKNPLMQFCERCHWLEAERITHKYDPRWGTGVWLGRHSTLGWNLVVSYKSEQSDD